MSRVREFRAGFLFCGLGAGARGFIEARASLAKDQARFVNVGGIDNDPDACADFEYLTGTKATCADISTMTPGFARMDVRAWEQPARTVAGSGTNGGFAVADPRPASFGERTHQNLYRVTDWDQPVGTLTGAVKPSSGAASVSDPRLTCKTLRNGSYGVMSWYEAAASVIGCAKVDNSPAAIADPRGAPDRANGYPVIIAEDGTWHRPITTLELAVLQGIPPKVDGAPLKLAGRTVAKWRERIGNAVPVGAGRAIAESLLTALLAAALGSSALSGRARTIEQPE